MPGFDCMHPPPDLTLDVSFFSFHITFFYPALAFNHTLVRTPTCDRQAPRRRLAKQVWLSPLSAVTVGSEKANVWCSQSSRLPAGASTPSPRRARPPAAAAHASPVTALISLSGAVCWRFVRLIGWMSEWQVEPECHRAYVAVRACVCVCQCVCTQCHRWWNPPPCQCVAVCGLLPVTTVWLCDGRGRLAVEEQIHKEQFAIYF